MGLVTNLRLIDEHGEMLSNTQMALYLNELVRSLPWQNEVRRALGQSERPGPGANRDRSPAAGG